jgi:translation initiation factor IF-1
MTRCGHSPPRCLHGRSPAYDRGALERSSLELFGTIKQVFPSTTFAVELENGQTILAHIAGRLRRHRIKILPGDRVDLEMSPYDLTKGESSIGTGREKRAARSGAAHYRLRPDLPKRLRSSLSS